MPRAEPNENECAEQSNEVGLEIMNVHLFYE